MSEKWRDTLNTIAHGALASLGVKRLYRVTIYRLANRLFFEHLVIKTRNFSGLTWAGVPVWQNVLDLWTIQETITEVRPALLIECGTFFGGSALFYAQVLDQLQIGKVVTIDITSQSTVTHPRIRQIVGNSISEDVLRQVRADVSAADGPIMVILDDDHSPTHVRQELETYAAFVSVNSFILVQDGSTDTLTTFRRTRPGPLRAIREFLKSHPEFAVDIERCDRFLITHHPLGWLRRKY